MMNPEEKEQVEARLRKVAGQVAGIQRMVGGERYCIDVLVQIAAVRAALGKISKMMLESHIKTCVSGAFTCCDEKDRDEKIDELIRIFDKNCN